MQEAFWNICSAVSVKMNGGLSTHTAVMGYSQSGVSMMPLYKIIGFNCVVFYYYYGNSIAI
jgi:hypothetical protein